MTAVIVKVVNVGDWRIMSRKEFSKRDCMSHYDCFANRNGKCLCLLDSSFPGKICPFYKSNKEISIEKIQKDCKDYSKFYG